MWHMLLKGAGMRMRDISANASRSILIFPPGIIVKRGGIKPFVILQAKKYILYEESIPARIGY